MCWTCSKYKTVSLQIDKVQTNSVSFKMMINLRKVGYTCGHRVPTQTSTRHGSTALRLVNYKRPRLSYVKYKEKLVIGKFSISLC